MPFTRVCGKMRWQIGGNLQPVRMICEFDWRECPSAIINYIWSEIVTDVVDCLTNEWMLWRAIAMLFVCTLLVHTLYSKTRWIDETTVDRENLNVVGCKVQDLELKVNILTYKMQYGTWPLPRQIRGTGIEGGLGKVRLTLTNSNDRNTWLKHMLLSPSENAEFVPFAKIGPRSIRCLSKLIQLETKYMASRFSHEASPTSNKAKSSSSDKSIKYQKISETSLYSITDGVDEKRILKSENLGIRQKDSTKSSKKETNCWSETQVLKYRKHPKPFSRSDHHYFDDAPSGKRIEQIFTSSEDRGDSFKKLKYHTKNASKKLSTDVRKFDELDASLEERGESTQLLKHREHPRSFARQQRYENEATKKLAASNRKSGEINKSPEERVHSTHETLHQVKEKLENLHSVLRIYGSSESPSKTEEVGSKKELAESILQDLKNLGDLPTESESDGKTSGNVPRIFDSNTEESQCPKEETDSTSEFEQCCSDRDSNSARSYENSYNSRSNQFHENKDLKHFYKSASSKENVVEKNGEEKRTTTCRETKDLPQVEQISTAKECPTEFSSGDEIRKSVPTKMRAEFERNAVPPSPTSSQTELSKDSDAEDKSNATLLREALKYKKALLTQIELEKEQKITTVGPEDSEERRSEESEGESDEPNWPKVKNYFQSKLLDIISEEQSASSSTEKTSKPFALANTTTELEKPGENMRASQAATNEVSNGNSGNTKLALISESSEYFSLSNLEEKLIAQTTVSVTRNEAIESSSNFTDDEQERVEENLHKDISDLVNQSVQNIREYVQVFSQMQNDAIAETRQAIIDENTPNPSSHLKECSSEDSIMHFVNKVAMADSICEQLPRKLSEPLINSLLDLEATDSEEESPENSDYKPDFSLKRRPGSIALAEQNSPQENNELSSDCLDARSLFESANSQIGDEDQPDSEILSSEPSCKELLMDYSVESESDFTDDKLSGALNLIEFDEETVPKAKDEWEDRMRAIDSPLTGRTVIRAASSSASNLHADSTNESVDLNVEFPETHRLIDVEEMMDCPATRANSQTNVVPESSSVYFTDDVSISEIKTKSEKIVNELRDNVSESDTWILDNPEKNSDAKQEESEAIDSAISGSLTNSSALIKTSEETGLEGCGKRPDSGETVVGEKIEREEIPSQANLSSDTSGTYMDASSRDYLNSSGISLAFDKSGLSPSANRIKIPALSKSARGSSSSPLQQRVPWNTPKRGSSLNNASSARSKKPEKCSSSKPIKTRESSAIDKTKNQKSKPTRSQSSSGKDIKVKSILGLSGTKDLESSCTTMGRHSSKSGNDLVPERRSRSYTTPRKGEASPRNSSASQPTDTQRQSRTRKDSEKSKTSIESAKSEKTDAGLSARASSKHCVTKSSSKSCIPILKTRLENARQIRAKSPMRGPLTMSMSSWSQEARRIISDPPMVNIPSEGNPETRQDVENSKIANSNEPYETLEKIDQPNERSASKIPESRTVIYVNIVTEQEHSATRVVDPKKFLEYLKDRDLKIQSVLNQETGAEGSVASTAEPGTCSSPRILTVVSSAVDGARTSAGSLPAGSNNSALTGSWSLRVQQREIEVSAKPSVIDTSTSISDLPEISAEARASLDKFKIFEVPKELTKDEYIVLLEALNQDPNLHQLREMHKLCNKLGLGFHE